MNKFLPALIKCSTSVLLAGACLIARDDGYGAGSSVPSRHTFNPHAYEDDIQEALSETPEGIDVFLDSCARSLPDDTNLYTGIPKKYIVGHFYIRALATAAMDQFDEIFQSAIPLLEKRKSRLHISEVEDFICKYRYMKTLFCMRALRTFDSFALPDGKLVFHAGKKQRYEWENDLGETAHSTIQTILMLRSHDRLLTAKEAVNFIREVQLPRQTVNLWEQCEYILEPKLLEKLLIEKLQTDHDIEYYARKQYSLEDYLNKDTGPNPVLRSDYETMANNLKSPAAVRHKSRSTHSLGPGALGVSAPGTEQREPDNFPAFDCESAPYTQGQESDDLFSLVWESMPVCADPVPAAVKTPKSPDNVRQQRLCIDRLALPRKRGRPPKVKASAAHQAGSLTQNHQGDPIVWQQINPILLDRTMQLPEQYHEQKLLDFTPLNKNQQQLKEIKAKTFTFRGLAPAETPARDYTCREYVNELVSYDYYSVHAQTLPDCYHLIIAGRDLDDITLPPLENGHRSLLFLTRSQLCANGDPKDTVARYLDSQTDICVVKSLYFNGRTLENDEELGFVAPRRTFALEAVRDLTMRAYGYTPAKLPGGISVVMYDDNVRSVFTGGSFADAKWHEFCEAMITGMRDKGCGFTGLYPGMPEGIEYETSLKMLPWAGNDKFCSKVLFVDMSSLENMLISNTADTDPKRLHSFSSLFFTDPRILHEDQMLQMSAWLGGMEPYFVTKKHAAYIRVNRGSIAKNHLRKHKTTLDDITAVSKARAFTLLQTEAMSALVNLMGEAKERICEQQENLKNCSLFELYDLSAARLADPFKDDLNGEIYNGSQLSDRLEEVCADGYTLADNTQLRPYQKAALKAIKAKFCPGDRGQNGQEPPQPLRTGYLTMATGTGKTVVMSALIKAVNASCQGNIAVIVPSISLLRQTREVLIKKTGLPVIPVDSERGNISGDMAALNTSLRSKGGHVLVFCEDSYVNFRNRRMTGADKEPDYGSKDSAGAADDFAMVIYDELHKLQPTTSAILEQDIAADPEQIHIGLSATPFDGDKKFKNNSIFTYDIINGIKDKYLVTWENRFVAQPCEDETGGVAFVEKVLRVKHPMGSTLGEHKGIWYVGSTKEADLVARELNRLGVPAKSHHSGTYDNEQTRNDLNDTLDALVAVRTLREGFDNQKLSYVYYKGVSAKSGKTKKLGKDKHTAEIIQMLGRTLRPWADMKKTALFVTSSDPVYRYLEGYRIDAMSGIATPHKRVVAHGMKLRICMSGLLDSPSPDLTSQEQDDNG